MSSLSRRAFLATTAGLTASVLAPRSARAADSRIEVLVDEPIGRIAPELHGHFAEHLGGVVYDGIWVGEGSKVPNIAGIRTALVEHLKRIKAPVIRWPGGCFADSYDWRDGVGPASERRTRTNFWHDTRLPDGPQKYDPNTFGTNEFIRFCQLTGAQPYLAANLRSLTPLDFNHWVEYANSPEGSTTLAKLRGGAPFNVRYWGVGNESWGCGGDFTPEEYATEYRRFTSWVPGYGLNLAFIGAGPNSGEIEWTRGFFEGLTRRSRGLLGRMWGWALHHYSWNVSGGRTTDWEKGKGDALAFSREEYWELLRDADKMESLITSHWSAMGAADPTHRVKLVVDEWGAWHRPGTQVAPAHQLGQQNTMRDALLAGLTLDTFYRHADKVAMANIAQLVNCLQALFLADGDRFVVTPTFHVFEMHMAHQGAQAVRTLASAPRASYTRNGQPATFWTLNGSASVQDKKLVLTTVNTDPGAAREAEIVVRGARPARATWTTLAGAETAHNSFTSPDAVRPTSGDARVAGDAIVHRFPPVSVTKIEVELL